MKWFEYACGVGLGWFSYIGASVTVKEKWEKHLVRKNGFVCSVTVRGKTHRFHSVEEMKDWERARRES